MEDNTTNSTTDNNKFNEEQISKTINQINLILPTDTNQPTVIKQVNETLLELLLNQIVEHFVVQPTKYYQPKLNEIQSLDTPENLNNIPHLLIKENSYSQLNTPQFNISNQSNLNDKVGYKLENLGYKVGVQLVERFTIELPILPDTLDKVKFICKEFWSLCFKKQIDNLKTNHRGVYVLNDNQFRLFLKLAGRSNSELSTKEAILFAWFPCGLIRGALASLGLNTVVVAETQSLPQCTFQIRVGKD